MTSIEQLLVFDDFGLVHYAMTGNENRKRANASVQLINQVISEHLVTNDGVQPVLLNNLYKAQYKSIVNKPNVWFVVLYDNNSAQSQMMDTFANELLSIAQKLWESLELTLLVSKQRDPIVLRSLKEKTSNTFKPFLDAKIDEIGSKYANMSKFKNKNANQKNSEKKQKMVQQDQKSQARVGKARKWNQDGSIVAESGDSKTLDFSNSSHIDKGSNDLSQSQNSALQGIDKSSFGQRSSNGEFLIKEVDALLSSSSSKFNKNKGNKNEEDSNKVFSFLKNKFLGNKNITNDDLKQILKNFRQNLISKNVAPDVATYLTEQVSKDLIGSKTANWTSVETTAKDSLSKALTKILTPTVSTDLLHQIQKKRNTSKEPFIFSIVGVNGVGKSTNLSKLAFWLLQNNFRVLIVACDTFRSGAVEQLRHHVENLAQLTDPAHIRGSRNNRGKSGNEFVELFEGGYGGSDLVTKIAKQATKYAVDYGFDIVLMDTAGRRHNDATLMSPLKSFAEQAKPDKIIMVGEALVGTDSVQQAKNFNSAFGKNRDLDFFIISKCDTVGDMLGTMVNMVYATNIPILFIGVGQTYTDIRTLSVSWAVDCLLA